MRVSGSHCVRVHACAFVCFRLRVFVHMLSYVCFLQLKSDTDSRYGKRHSFLGGGFGLGEIEAVELDPDSWRATARMHDLQAWRW